MDTTDIAIDEALEAPEGRGTLTDAMIKKGAALAAGGATKAAIQRELSIGQKLCNRLFTNELFRSTVADIADDAVAAAKAKTRADLTRMQTKAMKALEENLDKKSLEAVKTWLKAIGMDQEKDSDGKDGGFTLVLANQPRPEPNTITVKREGEDE